MNRRTIPMADGLEPRALLSAADFNLRSIVDMTLRRPCKLQETPKPAAPAACRVRPAARPRPKQGGSAYAPPSIPRKSIVIRPLPPEFSEITKKADSTY